MVGILLFWPRCKVTLLNIIKKWTLKADSSKEVPVPCSVDGNGKRFGLSELESPIKVLFTYSTSYSQCLTLWSTETTENNSSTEQSIHSMIRTKSKHKSIQSLLLKLPSVGYLTQLLGSYSVRMTNAEGGHFFNLTILSVKPSFFLNASISWTSATPQMPIVILPILNYQCRMMTWKYWCRAVWQSGNISGTQ